jgi:hypothetical protein
VRRLGAADAPPAWSDLCLGLMFMAAAPRGADVLDFEAEEHAILDATGGLTDLLAMTLVRAGVAAVLAYPLPHSRCSRTSTTNRSSASWFGGDSGSTERSRASSSCFARRSNAARCGVASVSPSA